VLELLTAIEVDPTGLITRVAFFDVDDLSTARTQLAEWAALDDGLLSTAGARPSGTGRARA
jgi:hypothetical protein